MKQLLRRDFPFFLSLARSRKMRCEVCGVCRNYNYYTRRRNKYEFHLETPRQIIYSSELLSSSLDLGIRVVQTDPHRHQPFRICKTVPSSKLSWNVLANEFVLCVLLPTKYCSIRNNRKTTGQVLPEKLFLKVIITKCLFFYHFQLSRHN